MRRLRYVMAVLGTILAMVLLTACGGGSDDESDDGGDSTSAFDVNADKSGQVREVAEDTNDDGTHTITFSDSTDPDNSVSVRVQLPSGWQLGTPVWADAGQAPGVVKAIAINPGKSVPDRDGKKGQSPRIYFSIRSIGTVSKHEEDKDGRAASQLPLESIASLPDWQLANKGTIAMGSRTGYFYTGTWKNPSTITPDRSVGTVMTVLVPSGSKMWNVSMVAARAATTDDDDNEWWTTDLEHVTKNIGFKSLPLPESEK